MADTARLRKVMDRIDGLPDYLEGTPSGGYTCPPLDNLDRDTWFQMDYLHFPGSFAEVTDQGLVPIERQEGQHCGTAGCFAGWAVVMFGEVGTVVAQTGLAVKPPTRDYMSTADYARELLDLTPGQGGLLFAGSNSRATLHRVVDRFCEEEEKGNG